MTLLDASGTQSANASLLARISVEANALVLAHPPRIANANKRRIHGIACPPGSAHGGTLEATRWRALPLPERTPAGAVRSSARDGIYSYAPVSAEGPDANVVPWHVNFADAHLFFAYGGAAFAQDEMQVAEHPALASLREMLLATRPPGFPALATEGDQATPVLVMGVERRCAITTSVDGRSLYGNAMHRASEDLLTEAVKRLDPPTISNILAIEAPPGGRGPYTRAAIERILVTAFTGFAAARRESERSRAGARTVIHTGHWGTGAYGGDRTLMAILQLVAARLAQIDELVFFTFDEAGQDAYAEAVRLVTTRLLPTGDRPVEELIVHIESLGFEWGFSDGN